MSIQIKKILIANRGEIAVRVIRACRELGIKSVAVYSDPDRLSPHVQIADEAYPLGGNTSAESYLIVDKILTVLDESGADAVHPGYGFLSENCDFATKIEQAGKIFIGPGNEAIEVMGSKTNARTKMINAKVPVVPGTEDAIEDPVKALIVAKKIGFPVLIKAAMGGGGKGMRRVDEESEFIQAIESAKNEALKAFNDDTVFIEKFVEEPRHIEIQVLGDQFGNYIHLHERECSVQRRHQKVVEEAPSSILTPELRKKMGEAAISCAKSVNYYSAGTVEFLVDKHGDFFFLEMNTRLQVEHPVTEMITGIDIVKQMIHIAEGKKLDLTQENIPLNGHAIECRIYAEDIYENFMPSTGKITFMKPSDGPGLREDSGFEQGNDVTLFYDPMISKLCAWAPTREEAIERMKRALKEYQISGIKTTIPFCLMVMNHDAFIKGDYDTSFVEQYLPDLLKNESNTEEWAAIAAIMINQFEKDKHQVVVHQIKDSNWKTVGRQNSIGKY